MHPRDWSAYRYYRVEEDGSYVGVDPNRVVHDGDVVVVETPDDHRHVVGRLQGANGAARLVRDRCAPLVLRGYAVLGTVALLVREL